MDKHKGFFVSIEGIDGSGKTTFCSRLADRLAPHQLVLIREPGSTVVSEKIRDLLLDAKNVGIKPRTEAMLYASSRAQLVEEIIIPALQLGKIVLADRYIDSTLAYQGYGRGMDLGFLQELNRLATTGITPDLTILLDLDPAVAKLRKNPEETDRLEMEGLAFQQRVREGYLALAADNSQRIKIIPSDQDPEQIVLQAETLIKARF